MQFSLSGKIVFLITVTLALELVFIGSLASLLESAERDAERTMRSKRVVDAINEISQEMYDLVLMFSSTNFTAEFVTGRDIDKSVRLARKQYQILRQELSAEPSVESVLNDAESNAIKTAAVFKDLKSSPEELESLSDAARRRLWLKRLKKYARHVLPDELMEVSRREKRVLEAGPGRQLEFRKQLTGLLIALAIVSVVMMLLLALVLLSNVAFRLRVMSDNVDRLGRGETLNPAMSETDEIGVLDRTFHNMAKSLDEARRKERAVVDNARDVICTIDSDGRFLSVNPAVRSMFDFAAEELVGSQYILIVAPQDMDYVEAAVKKVVDGDGDGAFESRVVRRDGSVIDTLWSVHWSEFDQSLFCVIHDDSERKQLDRMKQEVVAMITHDLRSPVTVINSFLEMLTGKIIGELNPKGEELARAAEKSASRMMSLINDLLDIEKIKSGMMELSVADVPLSLILSQTCQSFLPIAQERNIAMSVDDTDLVVKVDEDKVSRVLANLLSNALKFSPAGTAIRVEVAAAGSHARVSVCDQGAGIPEDRLATIFDRFTQVALSDSREKGGSGLGLTICRAIVELHGGTISVESTEGNGSTFIFTLPLA
jgi:PAS domain S-box-containing protein